MTLKPKKLSLLVLVLIPIGVAINSGANYIALGLKLPVYLDTIGTVLIASTCGPIPGAITGLLCSLIAGISYPTTMMYFPVTVSYGIICGLYAKKGFMTKWYKALLVAVTLAVCGVALSYPLTVLLFGGVTATGQSVILLSLQAMGFSQLTAYLISSVLTECLDKCLCTFAAFFLLKAISDRFLSKFPYGHLYIKKKVDAAEPASTQ